MCYCGSTCYTSCMYACDGCTGCSGCSGCKNTCKSSCNSTCTGKTQTTNMNKLTVSNSTQSEELNHIITAINFEVADRRGASLKNSGLSVTPGDVMDDALIAKIIQNLAQAGQTAAYSATEGQPIKKVLLTDLIEKITAANKVSIGLP